MNNSSEQFKVFADNLYAIFQEFQERADDPEINIEQQMMWAISANLAIKIASAAHAVSLNYEGTKQ